MKYCKFCGEYYDVDDTDHLIVCEGDFEKPYGGGDDFGLDMGDIEDTCNSAGICTSMVDYGNFVQGD